MLPGYPDNVRRDARGGCWVALNQEKADGVEVEELTAAKGVTLSEIAEKDNKLWLVGGARRVLFIFIFFENIFYRNIFSISQFTILYPYRPPGGRQGACRPAGTAGTYM